MILILLIFLLLPLRLQASCGNSDDPAYDLAVSQGDYLKAFSIVAAEVNLSPHDKNNFDVVTGYSRSHDDRHGQADPDTMKVHLDPGLFIEGKNGACQGVAHEFMHVRQFHRDRKRLLDYFSGSASGDGGWSGCRHKEFGDAEARSADAYACLEENSLTSHDAAMEIEAILSQVPYAPGNVLRGEDLTYLTSNLKRWADAQSMISDHSNESYYVPAIKHADIRIFCSGLIKAKEQENDLSLESGAWQTYCRYKH